MRNISLSEFRKIFSSSPCAGLGDDFFIMDIKLDDPAKSLSQPCRMDGFMLIYCRKGHIRLNVNLNEYELKGGMVFFNIPGNLLRINEIVSDNEDFRYVCIVMSKAFVANLQVDMNKLFTEGMSLLEHPSVELDDSEKEMASKYMALIANLIQSNISYKREAICSAMVSIFYMLSSLWGRKSEDSAKVLPVVTSRNRMVFDQFIKLVSQNYTVHRNVGFYADKLCLTPKYLSKLIRDTSGRSAPDWIDSYVVLEAKNLLKYSNAAIKEIVYTLNFPNQSVFYKFFKARTGMTPTEYRNS